MKRLSCKIFNEYCRPHKPVELAVISDKQSHVNFDEKIYTSLNVIQRLSSVPHDLSVDQSPRYYPAHPQIRSLVHNLRLHGLFR
jgi:hypothetical protein